VETAAHLAGAQLEKRARASDDVEGEAATQGGTPISY